VQVSFAVQVLRIDQDRARHGEISHAPTPAATTSIQKIQAEKFREEI
jgi:hypothetical protein